jgi:CheY-like chemotaxis protein
VVADTPVKRALVAEDNAVMREVLVQTLQHLGLMDVRAVEDGAEAVALMEREAFDVVLMDLQMPTVDGLRATRLIRAREKAMGGHTPIIAVTANAMQGERERCLAAGMDGYLTKPVRPHELAEVLGRHVIRAPGQDAPEVADWVAGLGALGFDAESIRQLGKTFLETAPGRVEALREALRGQSATLVGQAAHSLKGTFLVFGEREGSAAAAELEQMAGEGRLEGAEALVSRLDERVTSLKTFITAHLVEFS